MLFGDSDGESAVDTSNLDYAEQGGTSVQTLVSDGSDDGDMILKPVAAKRAGAPCVRRKAAPASRPTTSDTDGATTTDGELSTTTSGTVASGVSPVVGVLVSDDLGVSCRGWEGVNLA